MQDKEPAEVVIPKTSKTPKKPSRIPWWVSILMTIGSYCCLKYVVPELNLQSPALQKLSQAAPSFAPLVTIPFLLLAAKQLYDSDIGEEGEVPPQDEQEKDPEE